MQVLTICVCEGSVAKDGSVGDANGVAVAAGYQLDNIAISKCILQCDGVNGREKKEGGREGEQNGVKIHVYRKAHTRTVYIWKNTYRPTNSHKHKFEYALGSKMLQLPLHIHM